MLVVAHTASAAVLECRKGNVVEFTNDPTCPPGYVIKREVQPQRFPAGQPTIIAPALPAPTIQRAPVISYQPARLIPSCVELRHQRDYYRSTMEPNSTIKEKDVWNKLRNVQEEMDRQGCRI
ncbi:hypothetical protein [Chromobacterium subtsugae]|uniref:hypothetical protein n=1 Tax=Chromobacterium subtsugae TaxID=251747 RepID=UPI0006414F8D|nr:hypothetical protein [Chromobacterium subtsugae]